MSKKTVIKECPKDSRDDPAVVLRPLDENRYKSELDLLDRFHSFSAELLRLSLLGIVIFGFLVEKIFIDQEGDIKTGTFSSPKNFAGWSLGLFAIAAAVALAHLYLSTDAAGFYIHCLRIRSRLEELDKQDPPDSTKMEVQHLNTELACCMKKRDRWLSFCTWFKGLSALFLAAGCITMGIVFFLLLVK